MSAKRPPIWMRCWCWQTGRCLTDCPTADLPKPVPMTDANWKRAWDDLTKERSRACTLIPYRPEKEADNGE